MGSRVGRGAAAGTAKSSAWAGRSAGGGIGETWGSGSAWMQPEQSRAAAQSRFKRLPQPPTVDAQPDVLPVSKPSANTAEGVQAPGT